MPLPYDLEYFMDLLSSFTDHQIAPNSRIYFDESGITITSSPNYLESLAKGKAIAKEIDIDLEEYMTHLNLHTQNSVGA